jgi:Fe-S cluster biogenesis protein NfuA
LTGTKKENSLMRDKVQAAIDKIRPALQKDGGDVILIDVTDDGIVKVQLKEGIEKFVKSEIPEIISVESV